MNDRWVSVVEVLKGKGLTLALAESCTGGLISKYITDVPGASRVLLYSVVAYSNQAKESILGVDPATLRDFGAVSAPTAEAMCMGLFRYGGPDIVLSVTGIAGPSNDSPTKPIGLVYMAVGVRKDIEVKRFQFSGGRKEIRESSASAAADLIMAATRRA